MDRYGPFGSRPGVSLPDEPSNDDEVLDTSDEQITLSEPEPEPAKSAEAEKKERLDYLRNIAPPRTGSNWPKLLIGAAIILVVIVGAWLVFHHNKKTAPKKSAAAQVAPSPVSSATTKAHYVSNGHDLNLSFDYPSSWSVSPASGGNTGDQPITLNSPLTSITVANGGNVTGKVILNIRPVSAQLIELSSGKATAAQASLQFAYTKPTANQFQYPYLTFMHIPSNGNPTGTFQEVIVTGTTQFNSNDSLTADSFSVDPIISASFANCLNGECSGAGATPLNITNDTWQNANLFKQTLTVIESLQLN